MNRRCFLGAAALFAASARAAVPVPMPTWRNGMRANQFSAIPRTAPSKFNLEPSWNRRGSSICWMRDVIDAWNGLQTDETRGIVYSALAGGHAGTEQNGVYRIDLMENAPVWSVLRESTQFTPRDPAFQNVSYFADGRPTSRHTYYDGHVVQIDGAPVIVFVESLGKTYVAAGYEPRSVDAFHVARRDWDLKGGNWQPFPGNSYTANCVAKDPRTQRLWVADISGTINVLDPTTRKWSTIIGNMNQWGIGFVGSLIDPRRDRFVFAGTHSYRPAEAPAFGMWHMGRARYEDRGLTGDGAQHFAKGNYSGLGHDTINDKYFFLESLSGKVLSVDPDTFVTTFITQAPPAFNGCNGRFAFIPQLGGFIYLPSWQSDILFLPVTPTRSMKGKPA